MSSPFVGSGPSAIDSFFESTRARLAVINPDRKVVGMLDAMDWPPQDVELEAFYLLTLGDGPLSRQAYSAVSLFVVHNVQWVWIIAGSDIQDGLRGRSRGDRYRTHFAMKKELMDALYPYFAEKKSWSVDGAGGLQSQSLTPKSNLVWSPPTFSPRMDQASGLVYGAAAVSITEMTEEVVAA